MGTCPTVPAQGGLPSLLKFAALTLALFSGSYLALGPGRTVYSGVSVGLPIGAAQKVTPDPGSIWSFHETVTVAPGATATVPVLVDFDGNGVMDTEYPELRVMITDMQVSVVEDSFFTSRPMPRVHLLDSVGVRWDLTPIGTPGGMQGIMKSFHLATPLALPVRSDLNVEIANTVASSVQRTVEINLIGRVVNL